MNVIFYWTQTASGQVSVDPILMVFEEFTPS